jgi:hypothetical protein
MPKSSSPEKTAEQASTSAKARFFYAGVFALNQRKGESSQPKQTKSTSQDKKTTTK